MVSQYQRS